MADKTVRVVLEALVASYRTSMAQATASTKAFSTTLLTSAQQNSAAFTQVGFAALALGAGIGFAMKSAADAAIEFESSFAGVRKTVDATEPEFEAMAQGLRDMAKEIPVNVNELNRIAEAAGQLGVSKDAILGFTRTVAELGVTTNLTSDDAANALARIANIMGTAPDEFDRLGSTIVALGNAGASTEAEIVEFGLRIAGAGKIAGLAETDILAIGSAMSSVGVQAEAGGTAVQKVLIAITQAIATGSDKVELFARTAGMSAERFAAVWAANPARAFTAFVEGLGASGDQAIAVLESLGLTDQRLIRSFLSLAGAGDLLRDSIRLGSNAWEENTALAEEAGKRFETTGSRIQLAKNQINDAAISFGQIMLPAIQAVAGAIGKFAEIFGSLPAPVKTAALVLGAVAAAMSLLAGATLLMLPRLALVKEGFEKMNISGGLFRGSLQLAAKAINPLTVGLGAALVAVGAWANANAEAARKQDELTEAIIADSLALGENTREKLVNQLQSEGLLDAAETLGIPVDTATDAFLGNAAALSVVNARLDQVASQYGVTQDELLQTQGWSDQTDAALELSLGLDRVTERRDASRAAAIQQTAAVAAQAAADRDATDATSGLGDGLDAFGNIVDDTTSLTDQLTAAIEALAGTALDAEGAAIAWGNALADVREEIKDGTKTLDIHTQAGRDNRAAILDALNAAIDHGAAVAEETGSVEAGAAAVRRHVLQLIAEAEKAGIAKDDIHAYIRELNLTPKEIRTLIELQVDAAQSKLDQFITRNSGRTIHVNVETGETGPGPVHHAGGLVGASGARRMHAGGRLRGDEVPIIAQRGERVLSRAQTQDWERMHLAPAAAAPAASSSLSLPSGDLVIQVDGQTLARVAREELLKLKGSRVSLGLS